MTTTSAGSGERFLRHNIGVNMQVRRVLYAGLAAISVGCAHFQSKPPAPAIALDMPTPPARLLVPVDLPEPEPEPPVTTDAPTPPPAPAKPREPVTRPPATAAVPAAAPAPEPATPAPVLQTATETSSQVQKIKALLASADQMLGSVSYRDLSPSARVQFDQAHGYIRQANDAIKAKNYMFAEVLANKASDLARLLARG